MRVQLGNDSGRKKRGRLQTVAGWRLSPILFVVGLLITLVCAWATFVITHSVNKYSHAIDRGTIPFYVPMKAVVHTMLQSKDLLIPSLRLRNLTEFCCSWSTDVDDWWLRSPSWESAVMNTTHQCFRRIQHDAKRLMWDRLHATQFPTTHCQTVVRRPMTGSGWGIDLSHVVDGLLQAWSEDVVVDIVAPKDWQYVRLDGTVACASADPQCYFLPWTNCTAHRSKSFMEKARFHRPWKGFLPASRLGNPADMTNAWLLEYATRARTWLRREAVQAAAKVQLQTPCIAMHVRRGDVVLHGNFSRRYHATSEYLTAWEKRQKTLGQQHAAVETNVLLLTDDANAVTEATSIQEHASHSYLWFYVRRPRYHGPEGGWENQIPSRDPRSEVVFLHSMFHLVSQCHALVHSKSNLADYLFATMSLDGPRIRINLDDTKSHHQVHRAQNALSAQLSTKFSRRNH